MHTVREAFFKIRGIASAWISNQQGQDASEAMGQVTATLLDTDTRDDVVTISVDDGSVAEQIAATLGRREERAAAAVDASIANPPTKLAGLLSKQKDIVDHLQDMIEQSVHRPGECVWAEGLVAGGTIRNQQIYNLAEADIGKLNHRRDAFLVIDTMNALPKLIATIRDLRERLEVPTDHGTMDGIATRQAVIDVQAQQITELEAKLDQLKPGAAAADVLAERRRQLTKESISNNMDDVYVLGDLAAAAGAYALHAHDAAEARLNSAPATWPWPIESWKPSDPRRMLVKAGALILAEIERLDRAAASAIVTTDEELF